MVNPRLLLLRWKMESQAWLEAIWEERWFGIAITGAFAAGCIYLQWAIQSPGVSVAVMGVSHRYDGANKSQGAGKSSLDSDLSICMSISRNKY